MILIPAFVVLSLIAEYFCPPLPRFCPMQDAPWLSQAIVWTDFRIAVLLTVIIPLALLIWSAVSQSDAVTKLLVIYWRVASLLAVALYLLIAALPIGYLVAWFARMLLPISLWFWVDVNEEIEEMPSSPFKLAVTGWRWALTIYSAFGVLFQVPSLSCAFAPQTEIIKQAEMTSATVCNVWLQAPWGFRELLHGTTKPWFLGTFGIIGLVIYSLYLAYFVFFRLGRSKRSAMGQ
jgi:hypothetical protein